MKMSIVGAVAIVASCAFCEEVNLLKNVGFEEANEKGGAVEWSTPSGVYRYEAGVGENGSRGLVYENNDPSVYKMVIQSVPVKNGFYYKCSTRYRIESMEGKGGGVRICMEYYNDKNKWIGGCYANAKKKGDGGWYTLECATVEGIPPNAKRVSFSVFVDRNNTGKVYFDNPSVTLFPQPAIVGIVLSAYRGYTDGDIVRLHAPLLLNLQGYAAHDVSAELHLKSTDGKVLRRSPVNEFTDRELHAQFDTKDVPVGEYSLSLVITDKKTNKVVDEKSVALNRVAKMPHRKVYFDKHHRLIVNGKPFFPLGMYLSRINKKEMDILATGPFNCVMPYAQTTMEQLDMSWSNNIHVIYSVKDLYPGLLLPRTATRDDERKIITEKVNKHKDHPAVLAWYLNDELPLVPYRQQLEEHARLVEKLDPEHPGWVVLGEEVTIGYEQTYDVIGLDYYPVPLYSCGVMLGKTRRTVARTFNDKPVWMVPQSVPRWKKTKPGEPRQKRFPTLFEMRSMAWQCIAGGSHGLVFYSFFDMVNDKNTDIPFKEQWERACKMGEEIRRYAPVMLSVDKVPAITHDASEKVGVRAWKHEGKLYLLAVNSGEEAEEFTMTLAGKIGDVKADFGPNDFKFTQNSITCKLAAFEPAMFIAPIIE